MPYLVVGLGNPGKRYEKSRHNLGSLIVRNFAKARGISLQKEPLGYLGSGCVEENRIYLLLPTTYMNDSGRAVNRYRLFFNISLAHLLIVVDDLYLSFGQMRLRQSGSAGGHNGLKSIEDYLQTQDYPRFRIGLGWLDRCGSSDGDLSQFVLEPFASAEERALPEIVGRAILVINTYFSEGKERGVQLAALFRLEKTIEE